VQAYDEAIANVTQDDRPVSKAQRRARKTG
jgi:hypothetical protein